VPAEELADFNARLAGPVRFLEAWYGPEYRGPDSPLGPLKEQPGTLREQSGGSEARLQELVRVHPAPVLFSSGWWASVPAPVLGLDEAGRAELLARVRAAWAAVHPAWPLPAVP
jgi:hypothetical protein